MLASVLPCYFVVCLTLDTPLKWLIEGCVVLDAAGEDEDGDICGLPLVSAGCRAVESISQGYIK